MIDNVIYQPVSRFRKLLEVDNKDITQVYGYALFNGLVNLSLPLGIQAIINLIQGGEPSAAWIVLVSFVIAGIALNGVLQLLQLRIVENIAQKIFSRASFEFAFRLPRIKHSAFYNYYAPELANRFFDTMTIQKGLPKILIDFSLSSFQIVAGLIVLSLYHPFFIIFSIILVALIYIILAITGPRGMKTSLKESKYKYNLVHWLEEIARTKLSFKLVSNSEITLSNTDERVTDYLEARESHFQILLGQFLYLVGFKVVIAAGLLITGSILVFQQQMNIGQFVAAEIIIILIIASVEKLIQTLDSIYDVLTALEKIGGVTDMEMDKELGFTLDEKPQGISITASKLKFSFPDSNDYILKDVNFHIPKNSSVVLIGPAGSGKSTLLQVLAGIYEPQNGVVKYNEIPYPSINSESLKAHIGFALSNNEIFQGSILENIQMGRTDVSAQDVYDAMDLVNLSSFVSGLPMGLKTVLDPEGKKMPRSIQNKIVLARAIANCPELLMLEDPLDHVQGREKEEIIKRLTSPDTPWSILVTSVDPVWCKYILNNIVMDNGSIISESFKDLNHAEH